METTISKWGNSLALRIPESFARQAGLKLNAPVVLSFRNSELIITLARQPAEQLEDLLDQVTESNQHGEVDTGLPVGNEVW